MASFAAGCGVAPEAPACAAASPLLGATTDSERDAAGVVADVGFLLVDADVASAPGQVVHLRRICTLARIAAGAALTAAHCIADLSSFQITAGFGPVVPEADSASCSAAAIALDVTSWSVGPTDLLLVRFAEPGAPPGLPLRLPPLATDQPILLAGYGVAEGGAGAGHRRFGAGVVTGVSDAFVTVQVTGGGACSGDSGGPILARNGAGDFELAGVLTRGSPSCTGQDEYLAVPSFTAWLSERLQP